MLQTEYPAAEAPIERELSRHQCSIVDTCMEEGQYEAAISMLEPNRVRHEMRALQTHFRTKRDYVIGRLEEMGFTLHFKPCMRGRPLALVWLLARNMEVQY